MKKELIVAIICFLFGLVVKAQFETTFQNPKTPEVYLFERYGNIPISEYLGAPNITIPLHTIVHGDISIPLNIRYSSNGIRVTEEASAVGLGWYFGTGMISQTVQGKDDLRENHEFRLPDYYDTPYAQYVVRPFPDWWLDDPQNDPSYDDPGRIQQSTSTPTNDTYSMVRARSDGFYGPSLGVLFPYNGNLTFFDEEDLKITNQYQGYDLERDIFKANFFGHSIEFYAISWNPAFTRFDYRVMNGEQYKISREKIGSGTASYNKWEIIAPDGIKYIFEEELLSKTRQPISGYGPIESQNEYSTGEVTDDSVYFNSDSKNQYNRTWKITEIIDTKGNTIVFEYETLPNIVSKVSSSGHTDFIDNHYYVQSGLEGPEHFDGPMVESVNQSNSPIISNRKNFSTTMVSERSKLKEIRFSDSKIVFEHDSRVDIPGDVRFQNVKLYDDTDLVKTITFSHSYFNPQHATATQKRLKLDEILIGDQKYQFYYRGDILPDKNSNAFDYWGYYNGMINTSYVNDPFRLFEDSFNIPNWVKSLIDQIDGKANRSAHPDHCKAGILEKVVYPTGGSTELAYELNEFDNIFFPNYDNKLGFNGTDYNTDYQQAHSHGSGLRVKEITNADGKGNTYIKRYTYSGGRHITPYIAVNQDPHRSIDYNYGVDGGGQFVKKYVNSGSKLTSNYENNYQSSIWGNGEGVGYDEVTVEAINATDGSNNGKTTSYFTNVPDTDARVKFGQGGTVPGSYNDMFGYSIRNTDEDNGLLVKRILFEDNNDTLQKTEFEYYSIVPEIAFSQGNFNSYNYNVKVVNPGSWGFVAFSSNCGGCQNPTLSTHHEYLFFYYPLKQTKTLIKNKKVTSYENNGNITISSNYYYDDFYREEREYSINLNEGYEERIETQTNYINSGFSERNIFLPSIITNLKGNQVVGYEQFSYRYPTSDHTELAEVKKCKDNPNTSSLTLDDCIPTEYITYDTKGNLLEFRNNEGIYTSVIWGYDRRYPVALIENATFQEVSVAFGLTETVLKENGLENLSLLNDLRTSLPNAMITTYTYDPLVGVTSITDPRGYTVYYEYDGLNRLKAVKDFEGKLIEDYTYHYKNQ